MSPTPKTDALIKKARENAPLVAVCMVYPMYAYGAAVGYGAMKSMEFLFPKLEGARQKSYNRTMQQLTPFDVKNLAKIRL